MFKKISPGKVASDTGISITLVSPESLIYKENDCFIEIEWNFDPKSKKIYIYVSDDKNIKAAK